MSTQFNKGSNYSHNVGKNLSVLKSIAGAESITCTSDAAWSNLRSTLENIIENTSAKKVLEIGAGRYPFFSPEDVKRMGITLTISDIDDAELSQADPIYDRLIIDISGKPDKLKEKSSQYDLIFSRMVFEHVRDGRLGWQNVCKLLAPGGVGFAFVPTLYSPPFVINRIFPENLTSKMVKALDPRRNPHETPKFPAYYSYCRASEDALSPMLKDAGFDDICVIPFYGTPYISVIKGFRRITRKFDKIISSKDWRFFASYAYIIARK